MLPLPEGFTPGDEVLDRIELGGLTLDRAGLSARTPWGEEITGSAAGAAEEARHRARCELLERAATIEALRRPTLPAVDAAGHPAGARSREDVFPESDAPGRWRFARSSGVALHASFAEAARRARWELVERDRVLRAWYGELTPRTVSLPAPVAARLEAVGSHTFRAAAFDDPGARWSAGVEVVGVVGVPRDEGRPLALGWAGRGSIEAAAAAAADEALQQLAFLWDEGAPTAPPEVGPTALHHLEQQLWPPAARRILDWLERGHGRFAREAPRRPEAPIELADLTPGWLGEGLRVVRATSRSAAPLTFGDAPGAGHLPAELRAHPIA